MDMFLLWATGSGGDKLWIGGILLFFGVLLVSIFVLKNKENKRKRIDPNYQPTDLWALFLRALPSIFYWAALYVPAFFSFEGVRDQVLARVVACLGFLWLGRTLALLQQLVEKTPNRQGNSY